jgi:predicted DNA-binding protein with PD1-like motif
MRTGIINDVPERTFALILDSGEEVVSLLQQFVHDNNLSAGRITAAGAFSSTTLGYFYWNRKEYEKIWIDEPVEVLALTGDIALQNGEPRIQLRAVVGKLDGSAHGGHVLVAHVKPTLEVILTELPPYMKRSFDPDSGLPLIDMRD